MPGTATDSPASRGLVVALDGPASSGKSSVGAAAAARLGYRFCDTGLLYRAITWLALHRGVSAEDTAALVQLVGEIELLDDGGGRLAHVAVDGIDRTDEVRKPDVDVAVSAYSGVAELRHALLARQHALAAEGRIVMAGRDIGTVVLPDADLKLFLDASVEERARRRAQERGIEPESSEGVEILEELRRRDDLDSNRAVAPLRAAEDAVVIRTDGNTFDMTVSLVVNQIRRAEADRGIASARPGEAAPASGVAPVVARPERPRRIRRPAPRPTPIATRVGFLIGMGSAVLRAIARAILRLRFEGDKDLPRSGPLIVAANHASSADPVLIGAFLNAKLGRPVNWLGKRELLEFPLTGWAFRIAGIHPVDREAADLDAFRTAMRILEAGQVLAVFPEGTRSRDGALQQVREGVGMLALRSGAPVLPVAVVDSDLAWPRGRLLPRFGSRVAVRFGRPFRVGQDEPTASAQAEKRDRRAATVAATREIMARIAALLPPRQRGVYAEDATVVGAEAGKRPGITPSG
ncbi:MAG TPA: (d)CMP kinase [Patescibacteria group bacterium]|nr:(d)CMP kinase [Patescibacteria group bacterium]